MKKLQLLFSLIILGLSIQTANAFCIGDWVPDGYGGCKAPTTYGPQYYGDAYSIGESSTPYNAIYQGSGKTYTPSYEPTPQNCTYDSPCCGEKVDGALNWAYPRCPKD